MRYLANHVLAGLIAAMLAFSGWAHAGPPSRSYIVVLNDRAAPPELVAGDVAMAYGGRVGYVYGRVLKGFSVTLPVTALEAVAGRPDIAYIEPDLLMGIVAQAVPTGLSRSFAAGNANLDIDGTDDWRVDVDVAVLDTGIDVDHPDLNVVGGANCMQSTDKGPPFARGYYCDANVSADDDHYHGTHVAGTIGALDNGIGVVGVAPGARLWAVKVLDSAGSGYTSGIIAGIDWVVARGDIEVLNMSLGGSGVSAAYNTAIDAAVASGVVVVVAAGNSDADANNYSPAYVPSAITVSALADFNGLVGGGASPTCRYDQDDTLADFSNWGSAVDIAAPGVCILSTYPLEQGGYETISGTSMAAPHVAGAAALLASASPPTNATGVQAIRDALVNNGNLDWTDDSGDGTKERLLDLSSLTVFAPLLVENTAPPPPPPPPPPEPGDFTLTASGYKVKGIQHVDLSWSGATSDEVDLFRNGVLLVTVANDGGPYTDNIGSKGGGSYTYKACEAGTTTCGGNAGVEF